MKFLVLGTGMIGKVIACDLARSADTELVTLVGTDDQPSLAAERGIDSTKIHTVKLDVDSFDSVVSVMSNHDCVVDTLPARHTVELTRAAIKARRHFCSLGGGDDVLARQLHLSAAAAQAGIIVMPNCGLAPGLANIIAAQRAREFEVIDFIRVRVGCISRMPGIPFGFQLASSPEDLLDAYTSPCEVLRNGTRTRLEPLTQIETLEFPPPWGAMEAFLTSGAISLLPQMFEGKAREVDFKSIQYPGSCERFRTLLELGFASSTPITVGSNVLTGTELFLELLRKRMTDYGRDVVLAIIRVSGIRDYNRHSFECMLVDSFNEIDNITSLSRLTAFPTSIIAQLIVRKEIGGEGVFVPEQCVPLKPLYAALNERGIHTDEHWQ